MAEIEKMLSPQEVAEAIQGACGADVLEVRLSEWAEGVKGNKSRQIWIRMDRKALRSALRRLIAIHYPHLGVISCSDRGETIELLYHFFIYYGIGHGSEIMVTFSMLVPKSDPTIRTITDLVPGALTSEREKQEMIGIVVTGIPDGRRLFLDEDFPAGVFPWRRDEKGIPPGMIKELWNTGREKLAPAAPEAPKSP